MIAPASAIYTLHTIIEYSRLKMCTIKMIVKLFNLELLRCPIQLCYCKILHLTLCAGGCMGGNLTINCCTGPRIISLCLFVLVLQPISICFLAYMNFTTTINYYMLLFPFRFVWFDCVWCSLFLEYVCFFFVSFTVQVSHIFIK